MKANATISSLVAVGLLLAQPAGAGVADDIAIDQLASRLAVTATTYAARGWYLHDLEPVFLSEGSRKGYTVHLNAGDEIIFRAAGDADATDIDIAVYAPSGHLKAEDADLDATPFVTFVARQSGRYTVRLSLQSCRTNGSYCALLMAER